MSLPDIAPERTLPQSLFDGMPRLFDLRPTLDDFILTCRARVFLRYGPLASGACFPRRFDVTLLGLAMRILYSLVMLLIFFLPQGIAGFARADEGSGVTLAGFAGKWQGSMVLFFRIFSATLLALMLAHSPAEAQT